MLIYNIIYCSKNKLYNISCSNLSLSQYISKLQADGEQILHIYRLKPFIYVNKFDKVKFVISKCYNSKYTAACQKVKNNTISKIEFNETVELLKFLKETCQTKEEFEEKFKKYNKKY